MKTRCGSGCKLVHITGTGAAESTAYFGCWLDFNQATPRFPLMPPHNGGGGAFGGSLLSIQQLVRNDHCCLVAEIHYPLNPISNGATPGSHDNLSQRNLVVVESDNPGSTATHTVQSTFEIKPSAIPLIVPQAFGFLPQPPAVPAEPVPPAIAVRPMAALPNESEAPPRHRSRNPLHSRTRWPRRSRGPHGSCVPHRSATQAASPRSR
jgi:hypothetical protein